MHGNAELEHQEGEAALLGNSRRSRMRMRTDNDRLLLCGRLACRGINNLKLCVGVPVFSRVDIQRLQVSRAVIRAAQQFAEQNLKRHHERNCQQRDAACRTV